MVRTSNQPASQIQTGITQKTAVTSLWMQVAAWLDHSDAEWEEQCWETAETNPFLEVAPNPEYRAFFPVEEADGVVNPWQEWERAMTFAEVESRLVEEERRAFRYWLEALDHHGFVSCSIADVANWAGTSLSCAKKALLSLQSMDPPGIGARTVSEAVGLQLQRLGLEGPVERAVLRLPLSDWLREPAWLTRMTASSESAIRDAMENIRQCHPYPLMGKDDGVRMVTPHVSLWAEWQDDLGEWRIEVNDPYVLRYRAENLSRIRMEPNLAWEKIQANANHWMQVMYWRHKLLTGVVRAVVLEQAAFSRGDTKIPRPLTVAQVASLVGTHKSTVQRVLHDRFIASPRGILRLRQLVPGSGPDRRVIQHRIRYWMERGVTSDREISECLKREGIHVARRTVAKWRRELGLSAPRGNSHHF